MLWCKRVVLLQFYRTKSINEWSNWKWSIMAAAAPEHSFGLNMRRTHCGPLPHWARWHVHKLMHSCSCRGLKQKWYIRRAFKLFSGGALPLHKNTHIGYHRCLKWNRICVQRQSFFFFTCWNLEVGIGFSLLLQLLWCLLLLLSRASQQAHLTLRQ